MTTPNYTAKQLSHMGGSRLLEIANNELGLGIADTEELALIRAAIVDALENQGTTVQDLGIDPAGDDDDIETDKEDPVHERVPKSDAYWNEVLEVTVHEGHGVDGKYPLKVSHNGVLCVIHRGKRVKVKRKFLKVIERAIERHYERDEDNNEIIERDLPRMALTVHS